MEVQNKTLLAENTTLRAVNDELRAVSDELRSEVHKSMEQILSLNQKSVFMPKMSRAFALLSETVKGQLLNQLLESMYLISTKQLEGIKSDFVEYVDAKVRSDIQGIIVEEVFKMINENKEESLN